MAVVRLQINMVTMLDIDRKSSLVEERLPSNIRSSGALEAVSVNVQHGHHVYLKSDCAVYYK